MHQVVWVRDAAVAGGGIVRAVGGFEAGMWCLYRDFCVYEDFVCWLQSGYLVASRARVRDVVSELVLKGRPVIRRSTELSISR